MNKDGRVKPMPELRKKIEALEKALANLDIDEALRISKEFKKAYEKSSGGLRLFNAHAARVLRCFAVAIDFEPDYLTLAQKLQQEIRAGALGAMSMFDFTHLTLAEGMLSFHEEKFDDALTRLENAKKYAESVNDLHSRVYASYYLARSYWRKGNNVKAREEINLAEEGEIQLGIPDRIAVTKMLKGYLQFIRGSIQQAEETLESAETILRNKNDYVNLANVCSFRGQLCRRSGLYDDAIEYFRKADDLYLKRDPNHPNRARSLTNWAITLRLKSHKIEEEPAPLSRRESAGGSKRPSRGIDFRKGIKEEIKQLRTDANQLLKDALRIYSHNPARYYRGIGKCYNLLALLYLDISEFDSAWSNAEEAYKYGKEKGDHLLMAKARITQVKTISKQNLSSKASLNLLSDMANQAVEHAHATMYRRLQARAYIWQAHAALSANYYQGRNKAVECRNLAEGLMVPEDQDNLRQELEELEDRLNSDAYGQKIPFTFKPKDLSKSRKDLIKEFEQELVVYLYLHSEDRNKTAIAKQLNTSVKKVSLYLDKAGVREIKRNSRRKPDVRMKQS